MGAGLAFQAALEKYGRSDLVLLSYHVHIPRPDPMVNPSTLARQAFYAVRSSPSYFVDGESSGGGGSADGAKALFESRIDPMIARHLQAAPEAAISLKATSVGSSVRVKTSVSKVTSKSGKLKLQVALVENQVSFSGENGMRFHEMVVRALAVPPAATDTGKGKDKSNETGAAGDNDTEKPSDGKTANARPGATPPSTGFALDPGKGGTFEYAFDLTKAASEAKAHLEDFETNQRKGEYAFRKKMHEIDPTRLSVVAFVQDEATKKVLQAVYVRVPSADRKKTTD